MPRPASEDLVGPLWYKGTSYDPATCSGEGPEPYNFMKLPDPSAPSGPKSLRVPHPGTGVPLRPRKQTKKNKMETEARSLQPKLHTRDSEVAEKVMFQG